jgi:hypothetical protein
MDGMTCSVCKYYYTTDTDIVCRRYPTPKRTTAGWYCGEFKTTKTATKKKFIKPTIAEVKAYAREKGIEVDAEKFIAFYESKGWKIGKDAMVSWKGAVSGSWAKKKQGYNPRG